MKNALPCIVLTVSLSLITTGIGYAQDSAIDGARAWLGVEVAAVPSLLSEHLPIQPGVGLVVERVAPNSPAARAGFAENDVIVEIDGVPLRSYAQLAQSVTTTGVGAEISLTVLHEGHRRVLPAVLAEAPASAANSGPLGGGLLAEFEALLAPVLDPNADHSRIVSQLFSMSDALLNDNMNRGEPRAVPFRNGIEEDWQVHVVGDPDDPESRVTIRHGDETWNLRMGDLESLPDELSAVVQSLVVRAAQAFADTPLLQGEFDAQQWFENELIPMFGELQDSGQQLLDDFMRNGIGVPSNRAGRGI